MSSSTRGKHRQKPFLENDLATRGLCRPVEIYLGYGDIA